MANYKDMVKALTKEGKGEKLTPKNWEPKNGDSLVGELLHVSTIHSSTSEATFDKVTIKSDEGLFSTILSNDILPLSTPKVRRGDLIVITATERVDDKSDRVFMDKAVEIFHTAPKDSIPF